VSDIASLVFYILSFSCAALLMYYGNKRNNKVIIGFSLALPILVGALRFNVGTDYASYVSMYHSLSNLPLGRYFSDVFPQIEVGFFLLIKLSKFIANTPYFLFAVSSLVTVIFFYLGLKRYKVNHPALVYLLFLLIIFPLTLNIVRQGIAMSICFYALSFVIERRPKGYFFWVIIAGLFHTTALLILPIYFLNRIINNNNKNSHISILFKLSSIFFAVYLLLPYIFNSLASIKIFENYVKYKTFITEGSGSNFYSKFVIIVFAMFISKWSILNKNMKLYYYFLVFAILELLLVNSGFSAPIVRMALYFSFFPPMLLANFVDVFKDKSGKFFVYLLVISYGILYFYIAYYQQGYANVVPYKFMLGGLL